MMCGHSVSSARLPAQYMGVCTACPDPAGRPSGCDRQSAALCRFIYRFVFGIKNDYSFLADPDRASYYKGTE